jgi:hypothetical protein
MRPSATRKERMDDFCSVASWQAKSFRIDSRAMGSRSSEMIWAFGPYPYVRAMKRASERAFSKIF